MSGGAPWAKKINGVKNASWFQKQIKKRNRKPWGEQCSTEEKRWQTAELFFRRKKWELKEKKGAQWSESEGQRTKEGADVMQKIQEVSRTRNNSGNGELVEELEVKTLEKEWIKRLVLYKPYFKIHQRKLTGQSTSTRCQPTRGLLCSYCRGCVKQPS